MRKVVVAVLLLSSLVTLSLGSPSLTMMSIKESGNTAEVNDALGKALGSEGGANGGGGNTAEVNDALGKALGSEGGENRGSSNTAQVEGALNNALGGGQGGDSAPKPGDQALRGPAVVVSPNCRWCRALVREAFTRNKNGEVTSPCTEHELTIQVTE